MLNEIVVFVAAFSLLMLKMENKREWLFNIKHNIGRNWSRKWHKIPTTKLFLGLFVVLFSSALLFSLYPISINYLVWDLFFVLHFGLFILAGASLYLFIWSMGGRALRYGNKVGELTPVEGTEPSGKREVEGESFTDGMFRAFFDNIFGKSKKQRKKER